jgi:DNA ligase (NAD+)
VYDSLQKELKKIEETYPDLVRPDSPLRRIGGEPLDKFKKVRHEVPQWSFNDAFDEQGVRDWEERILSFLEKKSGSRPRDLDYVVELKIDGLHIVFTYVKGVLQVAATRGNGVTGEDVTHNILTIHSMPLSLHQDLDIIVEGEVWMGRKVFEKLNKAREKVGEPRFANPRNAAAGAVRQLDPKIAAERRLDAFLYDISRLPSIDKSIPTQKSELELLAHLGFKINKHWQYCKNIDEVIKFWKIWEKKRDSQDYWIDGVVVKVNQRHYQDELGFTGKAPRWALAVKFAADKATTKVKDIYVQVGRTGMLTPVAHLEPVQLAGTTVTHASLHNFDEIDRLDVRVGDTVAVEKAGDIIPKIIQAFPKLRTGHEKKVLRPRECPICGSKVAQKEGEVALYCANKNCFGTEKEKIVHFVGKYGFDIEGLGDKIVELFLNEGLIKDAADIFSLKLGDLDGLPGFAQKKAQNMIEAIAARLAVALPNFIFALGIRHVGEETAIALSRHFKSFANIQGANLEELQSVLDIGPKVGESIIEFFKQKKNVHFIQKLKDAGVKVFNFEEKTGGAKLKGKIFVLTGSLKNMTRDEAKAKIRALGGEVSESVSKTTDYVVVGEEPGSKFDKAKKLGVQILDESGLNRILLV